MGFPVNGDRRESGRLMAMDLGDGCLSVYPLRGERVRLRPMAPADAPGIAAFAADERVSRFTRIPHPYTLEDAMSFVTKSAMQREQDKTLSLGVFSLSEDALVGAVDLHEIDWGRKTAGLGYWVGPAHWGAGFATEAVRLMLDHGFSDLGLERVMAVVAAANPASARVLEKLGFDRTGGVGRLALANGFAEADEYRLTPGAFRAASARPIVFAAAAALIDADGRILLAQRPEGKSMAGLWEFPGGKVEPGETPERALIRELREELGVDCRESCLAPLAFASHAYGDFHLMMPLYLCRRWRGTPAPREGQTLSWAPARKLRTYPTPPADAPLLAMLEHWLC